MTTVETSGPGVAAATVRSRYRLPRTVPSRLRLAVGACAVLLLAFGATAVETVGGAQGAWSTVTRAQAPQVREATGLYQALTDQDAQTANLLLFGADPSLTENRTTALKALAADRAQADRNLQQATLSAQGSKAAQEALVRVLDGMGSYQDLAARALVLNDRAHAQAGHPAAEALADYRSATDLMRRQLLPAADRLVQANDAAFQTTYSAERDRLASLLVWCLVLGVLLLLALGAVQVWLTAVFRRVVNPGLAAATLLVAALVGVACTVAADQREYLRAARHDAFDSVVALTRARAVVYDANADESRYLLDADRAPRYEASFLASEQRIASVPAAGSVRSYRSDLEADAPQRAFGGFYGTEFRNITFAGEAAAAQQTLDAYLVYLRDDATIRQSAGAGRLREAIAYCTSYATGGSNDAFTEEDAALQRLIGINTAAFDGTGSAAGSELGWALPTEAGLTVLALVAGALGVRPRLREFRG